MRSWLGLYKTLITATPNLTLILDPFDKLVADRDSKEPFVWDRSLQQHFHTAVDAVDNIQNLYLPHPSDQLLIEVDAAKVPPGLGHTVYAIKDGKKVPVSFHSVKLQDHHKKWLPCELEALAFATAITAEYDLLKETKKPVIITPDSKSVADAVKLIRKGSYSTNPRIQTLITNVNRIPLIVQMASGKSNINNCSDYQSRHTSTCDTKQCAICIFTSETSAATLDPTALNSISINNNSAWQQAQKDDKACSEAKFFIKSGKTPSKRAGMTYSEIRRLTSVAKINKNDLLIVQAKPNKYSTVQQELTVIPSKLQAALLWQMHTSMQHPTKSQLKQQFDRNFYSVGITGALDKLYENCYFCSTQQYVPSITKHESKSNITAPGLLFHADVIQRQQQKIFLIRDHCSSFTAAKMIKAENNQEFKSAIIDLVTPLKLSSQTQVKVDNATGFKPILHDKDPDLAKLKIKIIPTDVFNKNANAVVDRACYELEQELIRIEPDGRPISNTTLQHAVTNLNQKLRRQGHISAMEIHFNRDMHTGANLNLNYDMLASDQKSTRAVHNNKHNAKAEHITTDPTPGDIVIVPALHDKHKATPPFLVTKTEENKVHLQKILHPFSENPTIRKTSYTTDPYRTKVISKSFLPSNTSKPYVQSKQSWNPIRLDDYMGNNEEEGVDKVVNQATNIQPVNDDDNNSEHDVFLDIPEPEEEVSDVSLSPEPKRKKAIKEIWLTPERNPPRKAKIKAIRKLNETLRDTESPDNLVLSELDSSRLSNISNDESPDSGDNQAIASEHVQNEKSPPVFCRRSPRFSSTSYHFCDNVEDDDHENNDSESIKSSSKSLDWDETFDNHSSYLDGEAVRLRGLNGG